MNTFEKIKKEKLLTGRALDVYEIVYKHPKITVGEIEFFEKTSSRNELAKRVSDLKNWGVIKSSGFKMCPWYHKKVQSWEVTGNLPSKTPKKEKKDLQIKLVTANLNIANVGLTDLINKWYVPKFLKKRLEGIRTLIEEVRRALSIV